MTKILHEGFLGVCEIGSSRDFWEQASSGFVSHEAADMHASAGFWSLVHVEWSACMLDTCILWVSELEGYAEFVIQASSGFRIYIYGGHSMRTVSEFPQLLFTVGS